MVAKHLVGVLTVAVLSLATPGVAQAAEHEREEAPAAQFAPQARRPAIVPALYATLGAMQVWDVYSTRAALAAGAREANPAAAAFAGNAGSLIGLKAASTVSTIFFAERLWKKNKVGAIAMLAAVNGATAAMSMYNMRNAKQAGARR